MKKQFIRFICNTKEHGRGEKIKALNIITKVYDEEGKFIETEKPYIFAQETQIEVDIEGTDYRHYLPLHHFKYNGKEIVKKSGEEIKKLEKEREIFKEQKKQEQNQKQKDIETVKNIMLDTKKTDKERLNAAIKIIGENLCSSEKN